MGIEDCQSCFKKLISPSITVKPRTTSNSQKASSSLKKVELLFFNARSIANKLDLLNSVLNSWNYDFIFTTETWLKPFYNDCFIIDTSFYNIIRADRINKRGGGVAVIYKNELSNKISVVPTDINHDDFDILAFDLHTYNHTTVRFVCVYIPPHNSKNYDVVCCLLNTLNRLMGDFDFYLLGDFNFSDINWNDSFHNFVKVHVNLYLF